MDLENPIGDNAVSGVWCTLVMLNDNYTCGAATLAQSLRNVGTVYPIWCMITSDVSDSAAEFLRSQFDNVVLVDTISHKVAPMKSQKQQEIYSPWIHASFTKWNVFNRDYFPQGRVCFLDADMIFLENCDDIMIMNCPAATFSSPWSHPYAEGGRNSGGYNPYYNAIRKTGLAHGNVVPVEKIKRGLVNGIVGCGCMVLVEPGDLFNVINQILNDTDVYGATLCQSGADEQILADAMVRSETKVYHIHPKYNAFIGKTKWLEGETPKTMQYYNTKPWFGIKSRSDVDATQWDDIKIWWHVADQVLEQSHAYAKFYFQ